MKPIHKYSALFAGVFLFLSVAVVSLAAMPNVWMSPPQQTPSVVTVVEEIYIPGGEYVRGCAPDVVDWECGIESSPFNAVYVDAFDIDRLEVTNAQYAACEAAGVCPPPLSIASAARPHYYKNPIYDQYPMINVLQEYANAYCQWVGKRLPTEAEWEKAARGNDRRWFPWGNELPTCERTNTAILGRDKVLSDPCIGDTAPVGSYPQNASPYGVLDMVGNVREWVSDVYDKLYHSRAPYYNPQGPQYDTGKGYFARGGGWLDNYILSSNWVRHDEAEALSFKQIGFRCARSAGPGGTPTPTPTLTPTPTPTPFAVAEIGPEGGTIWLSYPQHLTLLQVPANVLSDATTFELVYDGRPDPQGDLQGLNHFFRLGIDSPQNLTQPLPLILAHHETRGVIRDTIMLYRLEGNRWVTSNITVESPSTLLWDRRLAWIQGPGIYGLLGQTNRVYLPLTMRTR